MFSLQVITKWFQKSTVEETEMPILPAHENAQSTAWHLVFNTGYSTVAVEGMETVGSQLRITFTVNGQLRTRTVDSYEIKWVCPAAAFVYSKFEVNGQPLALVAA